jgi:hypothetical protein
MIRLKIFMKKVIFLAFVGLIFFINTECENSECDEKPTLIEVKDLFSTNADDCQVVNTDSVSDKSVDIVIANQNDFNFYIKCSRSVSVNFKNSFILAGKVFWPTCPEKYKQSLTFECGSLVLTTYIDDQSEDGSLCGALITIPYFLVVEGNFPTKGIKYQVYRVNY